LARCSSGLVAGPKQAVLRGVGHGAASLPFCGRVRGVRPQRPAHLAVWLHASHMTVSQADPTREHDAVATVLIIGASRGIGLETVKAIWGDMILRAGIKRDPIADLKPPHVFIPSAFFETRADPAGSSSRFCGISPSPPRALAGWTRKQASDVWQRHWRIRCLAFASAAPSIVSLHF
jgi:hypothetical protein